MMNKKTFGSIFAVAVALSMLMMAPAHSVRAAEKEWVFGLLLVGPRNDRGWSQAHFEAGKYVEKKIPGTRMIYIDKVNPSDRPGVTVPQLVEDMVEKGARLIIANSDDMKDGARQAALMYPGVRFIHVSGDDVLTGKAPKNLSNLMGRMEYGKMMAGFAAALSTKTGKLAYLGPLLNEETRRLTASAYLGARYAWEKVLGKDPKDLTFKVTWIGFWFNIPGVTADPTQVTRNFFNSGHDVVISGIDTTEALVVADQKRREGKRVWAVPYDYVGACGSAPEVCLGVPYFNWGPDYVNFIKKLRAGRWESEWIWSHPDWKNINDPDSSPVGFIPGKGLSANAKKSLDAFIQDLGSGAVNLFTGPLDYQDGSVFVKKGETATDSQVWRMRDLLKGMTGRGAAE
ncbi:BMP family ABC transporter substrate-binding protein [Candidatus Desulfarcum epimagneticum]|uniref:BMP family ABC transporter substrate-binding protein n=1 Tax=uncultured Desulfobacteraceae bacterium TaxID=218296 RepID=A0A484HI58_9BACT|nr:BMP family ABC transporter substrate-binding protein [uncultured Desulfobacteraceae bacterium]